MQLAVRVAAVRMPCSQQETGVYGETAGFLTISLRFLVSARVISCSRAQWPRGPRAPLQFGELCIFAACNLIETGKHGQIYEIAAFTNLGSSHLCIMA